jgi:hypothetical protein
MKPVKAREHADEVVTPDTLTKAVSLGRKRSQCVLRASTVKFLAELNALAIGFADGTALLLPVDKYPELNRLAAEELNQIDLGYAGGALCLEHRDLHISIAGLVLASESLMTMAASVIAARNGGRSSEAKINASKANGLKGGRPRKITAAS